MGEIRYYIVPRSDLGQYGDERGYQTIAEVNEALSGMDFSDDLVVIKGVELALGAVQDVQLSIAHA